MLKEILKLQEDEFEKRKLGQLEFCGNEEHECECSVKEDEIKSFIQEYNAKIIKAVCEDIKVEIDKMKGGKNNEEGYPAVKLYLAMKLREIEAKTKELINQTKI